MGEFNSESTLYFSLGHAKWLWWMQFFIPPTPPWSLTREVLKCHFHLNVNLKAVFFKTGMGADMLWKSICIRPRWVSECEVIVTKTKHILCFLFFLPVFFFKEPLKVFFCSLVVKRFLSTLIFSQWRWPAPRPVGENETLWCRFGSWIRLYFRLVDCYDGSCNSIGYFLLIMQWEYSRKHTSIVLISDAIITSCILLFAL